MGKIRNFVECFVCITTGILILAALSFADHPEALTPDTLWQILLSAGLCSVATVVFYPHENASRTRIWVGISLHFVSLCAIMIPCGRWFGWMDPGFWNAAIMVLDVVLIYGFTMASTYIMDKRQCALLNEQLKKKYPAPDSLPQQEEA